MAESELRCNCKHCRKPLDGNVWVTSCSHIFCEEDGEKHFAQSATCPACETTLSSEADFYKTSLNPNEHYRSMILAGQRPETVMDICSRALTFWNYQICQEKIYHEWVSKKLRDQATNVEQQYKEMLSKSQSESQTLKIKLTNTVKDHSVLQKRYDDLVEKYNEKLRQYQNVSNQYDSLRRKALTPNIYGASTANQVAGRASTPLLHQQTSKYANDPKSMMGIPKYLAVSPLLRPPGRGQAASKFSRSGSEANVGLAIPNSKVSPMQINRGNNGSGTNGGGGGEEFVFRPANNIMTPKFFNSEPQVTDRSFTPNFFNPNFMGNRLQK